jgi:hypothetical protein
MAMLFEHRARARGASSAATEERKIIGVTQIQPSVAQKIEFARRAGSLNLKKI